MTQKQWDDAYKLLVDNGFSKKPVLKGTGPKGGEAYAWAVANPDKVSCIYARNPLMKSLMAGNSNRLTILRRWRKQACRSCTTAAPWIPGWTTRLASSRNVIRISAARSRLSSGSGEGHFPLSTKDPKSVVEFHPPRVPVETWRRKDNPMKQPTSLLTLLLARWLSSQRRLALAPPTFSFRPRAATRKRGRATPSPRCTKPGTPPVACRSPLPFIWPAAVLSATNARSWGRKIPG